MKRRLIFHPLLFAAMPVLSLYVVNAEQLYWHEISGTLLVVISAAMILWLGFRLLLKSVDKSAWLISLFLITFFSYNSVWNIASPAEMLIKPVLWLGLLAAVFFWTARSNRDFRLVNSFLNVVSIGWAAAILVPWAYYMIVLARDSNARVNQYVTAWQDQLRTEQPVCDSNTLSSTRPNIYYIILDGYGRADILKQLYDFDNAPFLEFLKDSGFYVADRSISNYGQTALSQSSSLNFTYLDDLQQQITLQSTNRLPLEAMLEFSRLFEILRQDGYQIVTFPAGYLFTDISVGVDRHLAPPGSLTAFQTELLKSTPVPDLLQLMANKSLYDLHRERILYALEQLPAAADATTPTLVYAHILAPHPPFVFGPNGELPDIANPSFSLADGDAFTGAYGRDAYVQGYRDQLTFITNQIRQAIGRILASARRSTIIVVQGDHGPGSRIDWEDPEKSNFQERMSILNVYYFPDQNYAKLYPGISPVNTFRVILDQYLCADLPLLDDHAYFSGLARPYDFIDVTCEVNACP